MKKLTIIGLIAFTSLTSFSVYSAEVLNHSNIQHSAHKLSAPLGIMGDHTHNRGEYMFSYMYENMKMEGYKDGTDKISNHDILNNYSMAATDMLMKMHMLNGMYGVTDNLTAMVMVPYIEKEMTHIDHHGDSSEMSVKGLGDISISATSNIFENHNPADHSTLGANFNLGLSLPTGSIDKSFTHTHGHGNSAMVETHHMNYMMQLGSGTYDPTIGATLYNRVGSFYIGSQASYTPRFGKNDNGYRLGNEAKINAWVTKGLTDILSSSFRIEAKNWDSVEGKDKMVSTTMMPGGLTNQTGGTIANAAIGLSLYDDNTVMGNQKFSLEYGVPIYENLEGPQMSLSHTISLSYKLSF